MTYSSWVASHAIKHKSIVDKLLSHGMNKEEIIDYFVFENMVLNERDFCLLYRENKKCHDLQYLNCYLCACPHFRFNDEGLDIIDAKTEYSFCDIDSKNGATLIYNDAIHQDCSRCTIPHTKSYVSRNFSLDWQDLMRDSLTPKTNKS